MFSRLLATVWAVWLLAASAALGAEAPRSVSTYMHTGWTREAGAPANVKAIVQTPDGYLWLGTETGLYRFDGVAFELVPPPAEPRPASDYVSALHVARDGALWIGYNNGGVATLRRGVFQRLPKDEVNRTILAMAEDRDGGVWAAVGAATTRLARFHSGRWQTIGADWGLPELYVQNLLVTRDGAVWAAMNGAVMRLPRGSRRFVAVDAPVGKAPALAQDRAGDVWIADDRGARRLASADGRPVASPQMLDASAGAIWSKAVFDRSGGLWVSTLLNGVARLHPQGGDAVNGAWVQERQTRADGLTSDLTNAVFEDREGNVWVGTSEGLDRFRARHVVPQTMVEPDSHYGYIQFADAVGDVWIASPETLFRARPGRPLEPILTDLPNIGAICQGPDGEVWAASIYEIVRFGRDGSRRRMAFPGPAGALGGCALDRQGRVWFANWEGGVWRYDGRWTQIPVQDPQAFVGNIAADGQGRILADLRSSLVRWTGDAAETLQSYDRETLGATYAIDAGANDLLIGTERGLFRLTGSRGEALTRARFPWMIQISGLARTRTGQTWLTTRDSVIRLNTSDLMRAFASPDARLARAVFDFDDGLAGTKGLRTHSDLVVGGDGRVWIASRAGVFMIDPGRLSRNALPPPVHIRAVVADGVRHLDPTSLDLPAGTRNLQIDYAALSLSIPQRNQFRYRLEGFDKDWVDPGQRRQAFYTDLPPGRYVFRVKAANNDGVWNDQGDSLTIVVPPTFLQSWPFYLLAAAAFAGLLWLLYVLRLQQVSGRIREAMQARMSERERIARELHDTLLQGVQGLLLKLQAASSGVPARLQARAVMDTALDEAEDVLVEVRDRVGSLRAASGGDLVAAVTAVSRRMDHSDGVVVDVTAQGESRAVRALVVEEIEKIVTEALFNAHRHASAAVISVAIHFRTDALEIRVRDDGLGIPPEILARGKPGHYGIGGMRERARRIDGALAIESAPGQGSEIRLTVPGEDAYADVRPPIWRVWLRSLQGRHAAF